MGTGGSCTSPAWPFLSPGAFTRRRPRWRSTSDSHSLALGSLRSQCGRFKPRREPTSACSPSRALTGGVELRGVFLVPQGPAFTTSSKLPLLLAPPQAITLGWGLGVRVGAHTVFLTLGQASCVLCLVWSTSQAPPTLHLKSGDSHPLSLKRPLP